MLSARILSRLGVAKNRNWGLPKSRNAERETGAKPAVFSRCGMVLNLFQHPSGGTWALNPLNQVQGQGDASPPARLNRHPTRGPLDPSARPL